MEIMANSIYEQFENVSRDHSEKPALIYLGNEYNFSQLREATENLAVSLHRLGVAKGDKAVLYLPKSFFLLKAKKLLFLFQEDTDRNFQEDATVLVNNTKGFRLLSYCLFLLIFQKKAQTEKHLKI